MAAFFMQKNTAHTSGAKTFGGTLAFWGKARAYEKKDGIGCFYTAVK